MVEKNLLSAKRIWAEARRRNTRRILQAYDKGPAKEGVISWAIKNFYIKKLVRQTERWQGCKASCFLQRQRLNNQQVFFEQRWHSSANCVKSDKKSTESTKPKTQYRERNDSSVIQTFPLFQKYQQPFQSSPSKVELTPQER